MGQLHELLAAEGDVKDRHAKMQAETLALLSKPEYFKGLTKTLRVTKDMDPATKANIEAGGAENKMVTTTVDERLGYDGGFFATRLNHQLRKELTNQQAKGDLVVDNVTIARNLPATYLLSLEQLLTERRALYAAAPTLQAGVAWEEDSQAGKGRWKSKHSDQVTKTEKGVRPVVMYAATDKHPAQIEKVTEETVIGLYTTVHQSGMWTSARKAEVLGRIDRLIIAVKQARAKANQQEIVNGDEVGQAILGFIEAKEIKAS